MNLNLKIIADFEFVVDLDLAMFKFIRENYPDSPLINRDLLFFDIEGIVKALLYRNKMNPLEVIIPNQDTDDLYLEIMNKKEDELLSYARAYDTFGLFITMLSVGTSIKSITILCKNELEANYIKSLNPKLQIIVGNKEDFNLAEYNVLYEKYIYNLMLYPDLNGKQIYISNAGFNMQPDNMSCTNSVLTKCITISNELHTIDMYKSVKYRYKPHEGDNKE